MYKIPQKFHRTEDTVKGSRFITSVIHAPTVEEAKAFVLKIKNEFSDATHNCWAYSAGPPGDTGRVGMGDDGEPHGTAGKPMLNVLLHSEIGEIAVVVTRYFGGTKLGTGGLVRAYSGSVKKALDSLSTREKRKMISLNIVFDYPDINCLKKLIESLEGTISAEKYEVSVSFDIKIPEKKIDYFTESAKDLTGGKISLKFKE